ncbi:MAG TPA: Gfo/Idh/MocA family oxidoreductase, partial [Solirubrobacteraceae bacterium]|nr:Gfo/Idh/MocA family oxidoreductase [Solirubrobacteraceae bacterium]
MDGDRTLRGAVLGLGMIGRHHARILQTSPGVEFAGAVDPGGDRFRAIHDRTRLHGSLDELLREVARAGRLDFAIVAVPTEEHLACVER